MNRMTVWPSSWRSMVEKMWSVSSQSLVVLGPAALWRDSEKKGGMSWSLVTFRRRRGRSAKDIGVMRDG